MTANTPSPNDTKPQKELLLDYLLQGNRPTVNEALQELGIYALSQRVGDLIRQAYQYKANLSPRQQASE